MNQERIILSDGEKDVEMTLLASFGVDHKEYCLVDDGDGAPFFLRYFSEGHEMLFQPIESEEEFEAVESGYEDLLRDRDGDQESEEEF